MFQFKPSNNDFEYRKNNVLTIENRLTQDTDDYDHVKVLIPSGHEITDLTVESYEQEVKAGVVYYEIQKGQRVDQGASNLIHDEFDTVGSELLQGKKWRKLIGFIINTQLFLP